MEATERQLVLKHLAESRSCLLQAVEGLSAEQRTFRTAQDRWSVADCVEHITVVENSIFNTLQQVLQAPPEPAKKAGVVGQEQIILERVPSRNQRVKGPERVMPKGRWPEFDELCRQFEATRERSVRFAADTQADLHNHFFPHPLLGQFDCYQWLLFLGMHCERHVRQLEEVKADPAFPRGR